MLKLMTFGYSNMKRGDNMKDYTQISTKQLIELSSTFQHEEYQIMKELIRRNTGNNLPEDLEHADMQPTEDDF